MEICPLIRASQWEAAVAAVREEITVRAFMGVAVVVQADLAEQALSFGDRLALPWLGRSRPAEHWEETEPMRLPIVAAGTGAAITYRVHRWGVQDQLWDQQATAAQEEAS